MIGHGSSVHASTEGFHVLLSGPITRSGDTKGQVRGRSPHSYIRHMGNSLQHIEIIMSL